MVTVNFVYFGQLFNLPEFCRVQLVLGVERVNLSTHINLL